MPKQQLVLCFDGTNNNLTGGQKDTNVVKLCKVLSPAPPDQVMYYDPGVGNPANIPGVTWSDKVRGKIERLWGLALGKGVYENMANAYLFLMRNWQPGDEIYVFGFSRGAFTARSVAGMVTRFGIMRASMEEMVPTLLHLYFADHEAEHYKAIQRQIAESFCTPAGAVAPVWFVGVWDTVESVGSPLSRRKIKASASIVGKRFQNVRQALALDEHRRSFAPRPYYIQPGFNYQAAGQSIKQEWWSGSHCDLGGGYIEPQSELSDHSFLWMLQEAFALGLEMPPRFVTTQGALDSAQVLSAVRAKNPAPPRPALVHSETFTTAYWALTGLCVRDFDKAEGNRGDPPPAPPVAHGTPSGKPLQMPQDTVWRQRHAGFIALALVVGFVFWLLYGLAITGVQSDSLAAHLQRFWDGSKALAQWQLQWWFIWDRDAIAHLAVTMPHPLWAVAADLGLIACYGYILASGLARGFAHWAGLRQPGDPAPKLLNALGWSGAIIVGGDLLEDLFMLLAMGAHWLGWSCVSDFCAVLMSIASAAKRLGCIPAALLMVRVVK